MKKDLLLILDFGSQYSQLIARRVRELGVYCELKSHDVDLETIRALQPKGIILSGGPESTLDAGSPQINPGLFELDLPLLGICYGMQSMAAYLGGQVVKSNHREYGHAKLSIVDPCALTQGLSDFEHQGVAGLNVWMSHGDKVSRIPHDFKVVAKSDNAEIAMMAHLSKPYYGIQFHPEVTHTPQGMQILSRFVKDICGCKATWQSQNIIQDLIQDARAKVGKDQVLLGLSGGVDSSVVAALLQEAIGDQLICVFVDHGLLRANEAEQVKAVFEKQKGLTVHFVNAQEQFLSQLTGVTCPEEKRKIIGKTFIDVFTEAAKAYPDVKWLAQGTIYPDVIESADSQTGKAHVIKSHHNVGGLPESLPFKLIEPLRMLFKDEVRKIGLELGLPSSMIDRHPFPGPGLGVRILGEVKPEYVPLLQQADAIFLETLHRHDWYHQVSQAFAVFLPVKAVGVVGDARQYEYVVALRAVVTVDFMTATWAHLPYALLEEASSRIINEVKGIARVTYDISSKPPATIEWE